ncbi:MAG: hypothetical protein ACKV0T_15800 [Planctomycetales bacterium]
MVSALRLLAIFAGVACVATIGFAADPKEPPKPKVEIRWVERFRVEGLTVDRIVGDSDDSPGYYPHAKPAMILTAKDIVEARLSMFDWLMSGVVVHHYSVKMVLTKDARERLAKSCPSEPAAITVSVDGMYSGWTHYTIDNDAKVSEQLKAKNYNPTLGNMDRASAERIINAFKQVSED